MNVGKRDLASLRWLEDLDARETDSCRMGEVREARLVALGLLECESVGGATGSTRARFPYQFTRKAHDVLRLARPVGQ